MIPSTLSRTSLWGVKVISLTRPNDSVDAFSLGHTSNISLTRPDDSVDVFWKVHPTFGGVLWLRLTM